MFYIVYSRGPQPVDCGPLQGRGLLATGLQDRLANACVHTHIRVSAVAVGRKNGIPCCLVRKRDAVCRRA